MLQQCASQHQESLELQRQQLEGIVDMLKNMAEWDKQFKDNLLAAMGMEAQEDRKVLSTDFRDNLKFVQECFSVIHEMSQTIIAYYQEKARKRFGS